MTSTTRTTGAVAVAVALLVAVPAAAQGPARNQAESQSRSTELGAVTVVAPRIVYRAVRREGGSVIPKEISLIQRTVDVSYNDLDLMRSSDMYVLEERIARAAHGVCNDLAREVPDGEPDTAICVRRASKDAMALVRLEHPAMASRP